LSASGITTRSQPYMIAFLITFFGSFISSPSATTEPVPPYEYRKIQNPHVCFYTFRFFILNTPHSTCIWRVSIN